MIREYFTDIAVIGGVLLLSMTISCNAYKTVEAELYTPQQAAPLESPLKPEMYEMLEEVHAITGFWIKPVRDTGFTVEVVPGKFNIRGRVWKTFPPCFYHVRSSQDPRVLAHELAHVLGLHHVDDKNNLMDSDGNLGPELTKRQRDTMKRTAQVMEHLCWDSAETPPNYRLASVGFKPELLCDLEFKTEDVDDDAGTDSE